MLVEVFGSSQLPLVCNCLCLVLALLWCASIYTARQSLTESKSMLTTSTTKGTIGRTCPASRQALSRPPLLAHSSTGQPRLLFATFRRTEFTVRLGVGRSYKLRFWSGCCALGGVVTRQGSRSVHRCSRRSATTRRTAPACVAGDRSSHRLALALKIVACQPHQRG